MINIAFVRKGILFLTIAGCLSSCDRELLNEIVYKDEVELSLKSTRAIIWNHDLWIENESGRTLKDVVVTVALIDAQGGEYPTVCRWKSWKPNEEKHVTFSQSRTTDNPQRVVIRGTCHDGDKEKGIKRRWSLN